MRRRAYLALLGSATLAGCLDGSDDDTTGQENEADSGESGDDQTETESDEDDQQTEGKTADEETTDEQETEERTVDSAAFEVSWRQILDTRVVDLISYDAAIDGETLVVGSKAGVNAFDTADGTEHWHREAWREFEEIRVTDGVVAGLTRDLEVVVLDAETGKTHWTETTTRESVSPPPIALNDRYVAIGRPSSVTVHDRDTGKQEWKVENGAEAIYATERLFAIADLFDSTVMGYDMGGRERWTMDIHGGSGGAVTDGLLVVPELGVESHELVAVDIHTGTEEWSADGFDLSPFFEIGSGAGIAVVIDESEEEDTLTAVSLADGTRTWETSVGSLLTPFRPPAIGSGLVVSETENGVGAYTVETGEQVGETTEPFLVLTGLLEDGTFFDCGRKIVAYEL